MICRILFCFRLCLYATRQHGSNYMPLGSMAAINGYGALQCSGWGEGGTQWRGWLRHYATRRKVAGSIPDGVI